MAVLLTVPRVHIKGLEDNGDKEELRRLFGKFGPLRNVWIATKPPGFAYVFFESFEDAEKAVDYYNGKRVCGMNVRVELSPIEDKWRPRPPPPPRRLHPPDRRRRGDKAELSFSDNSYDSDYERRFDGFRGKNSRGASHYRDDYPRGRPHHPGGSRGEPPHSHSRRYSDERRHHHPERSSSFNRPRNDGRGRYEEDEYRHRVRSREDHRGDSFRGRVSSRGGPDRYHSSGAPKHFERSGGSRPHPYADGRAHIEKSYKRPRSSRHLGPSPRHHSPDYPPPPRRRVVPVVDSEYVARQYRLKRSRNGEFGESSKNESRHRDLEYRHSRKMVKEDMYRMRDKGYDQGEPGRDSYHRHSSGPRRSHHGHTKYYESKEMRSRSPLSSTEGFNTPPPGYYSGDHSPSRSGSRSRSVSNPTSDTSRGPSATPSPPPHPHHLPPSCTPSRSASPMFPQDERYSNEKYSRSPQENPNYGTPSPEHVDISIKLTPSPPPPPPPAPVQSAEQGVPSPAFVSSPVYVLSPEHQAEFDDHFEDEQNIELEEANLKKEQEYKKIKREVRNQDRDRQISYQEKSGKHRYSDRHLDSRMIEDREMRSRPLSESFDLIGSSKQLSPPPQRRARSDTRRRSSHKEDSRSGRVSGRHIRKNSPMSDRMMKRH